MQTNDNYFSQYGSSLLEVILSITLALVLVPFMYVQISDMNESVKDIATANKIVKTHDSIKNYIQIHNAEFSQNNVYAFCTKDNCDENECYDCDALETIAPGAQRGVVVQNATNGTTEMFVEFNIDNTKYRSANVARYIGHDAAIVSGDKIAYSEYWATVFDGNDAFTPGNLVYHVESDGYIDDEENYLHTTNADGYNVMERNLDLNGKYNITDAMNVETQVLDFSYGTVDKITLDNGTTVNATAANIVFGPPVKTQNIDFEFVYLNSPDGIEKFTIKGFNLSFEKKLTLDPKGINASGIVTVSNTIKINGDFGPKNEETSIVFSPAFNELYINGGELSGNTIDGANFINNGDIIIGNNSDLSIPNDFSSDGYQSGGITNLYIGKESETSDVFMNVSTVLKLPNNGESTIGGSYGILHCGSGGDNPCATIINYFDKVGNIWQGN